MSILTFREKTDRFQNSSHIDYDILSKEFTSHAFKTMRFIEDDISPHLLKKMLYLQFMETNLDTTLFANKPSFSR
jgi:hypothetical protein